MKKNPASQSGLFNPRVLLAPLSGALCSVGVRLGVLSFAAILADAAGAAAGGGQENWSTFALPFPPGRAAPSFAFDPVHQQVVAFGGVTSVQFGDTWLFNGTTWTQANPTNSPSARSLAGMAYDPTTQSVLMFGGQETNSPDEGLLGDTWSWDGTTWTQLQPATSPPARYGAAMTTDPATGTVLLFGGSGRADTWRWDGVTWTELHPSNPPTPRNFSAAAADAPRNQVVLFGGQDANTGRVLPDTYVWDGQNWYLAATAGPPGRAHAGMASDSTGKLVLFGGFLQTGVIGELGDTWTWNGTLWTAQTPGSSPAARYSMGMAFDPATGQTVLFGGQSFSSTDGFTYYDDTWAWDGSAWTKPPVSALPPRRSEMGLASNSAGQVVIFGGWDGFKSLGDTWTWNNGVWTEHSPSVSPPARSWAMMAFDPTANRAVLFGGFNNGASLGDTWIWDGAAWTLQTPASSPTPRYGASMVTDPATGRILLFGGTALGSGYVNETWEWAGSAWTQLHPANNPPGRYRPGMAADPATGTVVLFGGLEPGTSLLGDTWVWNGTDWQQAPPGISPSPRLSAVLAFDVASNTIVLFGGSTLTAALGDTWIWDGSAWTEVQPSAAPSPRWSPGVWSNPGGGVLLFGGEDLTTGGLRDTWLWSTPPPVQLPSVVSRKVHASAGTFDIDLPIAGSPGIECRSGGANGDYTVIFSFVNTLTSVGGASVTAGTGTISSGAIDSDAHQYIVNLTGVTNAQMITVSLTNVNDSVGNSSASISVPMSVLAGDTTANKIVSNTDVASVKAQVSSPVTASNFRNDVNANGIISNTDVSATKTQVGTTLP